jgi:hypothetical protein
VGRVGRPLRDAGIEQALPLAKHREAADEVLTLGEAFLTRLSMAQMCQEPLVVDLSSFVEALVAIDSRHFLFEHFSFCVQLLLEPERVSSDLEL